LKCPECHRQGRSQRGRLRVLRTKTENEVIIRTRGCAFCGHKEVTREHGADDFALLGEYISTITKLKAHVRSLEEQLEFHVIKPGDQTPRRLRGL
jgi:type II secretory ATPase GspE/PulE/Tfp pilus assembly ATPase PilB-like protein